MSFASSSMQYSSVGEPGCLAVVFKLFLPFEPVICVLLSKGVRGSRGMLAISG